MRRLLHLLLPGMLLLSSCYFLESKKEFLPLQAREASTILRKAAEMTQKNNFQQAIRFYQDAYSRFSAVNDEKGKAKAILGMIKTDLLSGDAVQADSLTTNLTELVAGNSQLTRYQLEAKAFFALQNKNEAALKALLAESTASLQPLETSATIASWIIFTGKKTADRSDSTAVAFLERNYGQLKALYMNGALENDETPATAAYALGYRYFNEGDLKTAAKYTTEALTIDQTVQNSKGVADDCWLLGKICFGESQFEKAAQNFGAAGEVYSAIGDTSMTDLSEAMSLIAAYKANPTEHSKRAIDQLLKSSPSKQVRDAVKRWLN